jgi:outer membrane protein assembly factor BamB
MEIFGYFCSPLCKSKAEVQRMAVPAYGGSTHAAEERFWRKMVWIFGVVSTLAVVGLGVWIWYAWIASMPHTYFSVTFDQISHSGSSYVNDGQIVFLHGGTLARYDLKTGKQIWSDQLISQDQIDAILKGENNARAQERDNNPDGYMPPVNGSMDQKYARIGLESALSLYCTGQTIWVAGGGQLTHYDWNSGNVLQQIAALNGESTLQGNNLLAFGRAEDGSPSVVQVDLASGNVTTNVFHDQSVAALGQNSASPAGAAPASGGGLPLSPYGSAQPMDSQRASQQVQNMSLQGQIALPAILANNSYEQRIEGAMNDGQDRRRPQQVYAQPQAGARPAQSKPGDFTLIPDNGSYEEFSSQMIQENFVQHEAMKSPQSNTALENATSGNKASAVNEQLNDMQRNNGNDKVTEDDSTYSVTLRQAGSQSSWTGQVIGPPQLIPLKSVTVLAAGKMVIVFDKSNNKLWQTTLTYNITGGDHQSSPGTSLYGDGPCVEHDGALYIFDQAVLSAFDLTTGNNRWRIPTVGVVGLFFDPKGMLYVNTTTGNPDDIKYSREIDVTKSTEAVILKIDPATGRTVWTSKGNGFISYLSGPFIYTLQTFNPGDEEDQLSDATAGLMKPALTRIIRLNSSNGQSDWQYDESLAAMNVQFDDNFIRIIFKKEVRVLHFLSI